MLKTIIKPLYLNLQLFSDGGAEGSGTGEGGTMGENGMDATSEVQITDSDSTTAKTIDINAEFADLIKGKYKDAFNNKVQGIVQNRLKGTKEITDKYESIEPMLETLAKKHGVNVTDIEALKKAVEEDDYYFEEEANDLGITVAELKNKRKLERENADLRKQLDAQASEKKAAELYSNWMKQSELTKTVYPSFDFETEMQSPQFMELLRIPGVDVRTAYELTHKDEIIAGAMQFAAQTVEKKMADNIRANGMRPNENGMASQSAALTKSDVSQLSKAELLEIQRKVMRGEKVDLTYR